MARNITVTFSDGTSHVYQNAPDTISPADVQARASSEFAGKTLTNIDGGAQPATAPVAVAAPAPSLADTISNGIASAASTVSDVASSVYQGAKSMMASALPALASSSEGADGIPDAGRVVAPPAPEPGPNDRLDALSASAPPTDWVKAAAAQPGVMFDNEKSPTRLAAEQAAATAPQARAMTDAEIQQSRDTIPENPVKAGFGIAASANAKTIGYLASAAGNALDSWTLKDVGSEFQTAANARLNHALANGNADSNVVKTAAGVFGLAPLLAGGPGVASMVTQAGVNGYGEAIQAGDTPVDAINRGTAMALANYIGMRVQVPGLTGALSTAVKGAPAADALSALGHALATNVGGMEANTVVSDLYDKVAPGGLKPNMTVADMLGDIGDTAKSATLLTLAMPGLPLAGSHLYSTAHALANGGSGAAEAARAIDAANPPPAATPIASTDNAAAAPPAPSLALPVGLDTLHDSIDDAARAVGLTPKAAAALRDAAANQDPQDAAAFVARAFHRFEANGLTTKAGAPGAFRDALAQRVADQQPDEPPATAPAAPAPGGAPSVADQLAAIRPLGAAPAPDAASDAAPVADQQDTAQPAPITPTAMAQANDIAAAAHGAATSPFNNTPEPTDAQKAAGNYQMGHVQLHGLDITIENPQGSVRSGVSPDGTAWQNEMAAHYGYIKGTHAADGDHVDTFIGPNPESKTAYVIDQVDPTTGKFDEPKTILGADSEAQARQLYAANYADGWNGLGAITPLPMDAFKAWVRDGVKNKPLGDITQWKPTDERAQPDVAKPAGVPAGAGDGGGGPAVAGGGDLRPDADVTPMGGVGGDAAAPAGGAGAAAAVDAGGKPEPALTSQAAPFYSQLHRALSGLNMRAGDAGAWRQALKGAMAKGVKAEEISHSGIEDWLKLQDGKVTKQQVLDYLDGNGVRVTEMMLGGDQHFRDANGNRVLDENTGGFVPSATAPKFEGYTLPGGKNYRELLLTLPSKEKGRRENIEAIQSRYERGEARPGDQEEFDRLTAEPASLKEDFHSGHWDQPNVLAHVRFNDRTDANGKKVLFVEEMQSDWGQSMKKLLDAADPGTPRDVALRLAAKEGTPNGPFIGKTDAWLSLAMKRIVKYAVDHGYDRVAFTNGEQNAARYDLSKQISSLRLHDNQSGGVGRPSMKGPFERGYLRAYGSGDRPVIDRYIHSPEDLEQTIGKETAAKLLASEPRESRAAGIGVRERTLEGLDLKVGGDGMRAFYDKIVPSVAKDVVRKLGGDGIVPIRMHAAAGRFSVDPGPGEEVRHFDTRAEAEAFARTQGEGPDFVIDQSRRASQYVGEQPGFDITDKMRAAAADGMPLFKQSGDKAPAKGVDPVALRAEVTRIQAGWKDAPPVHVVDDVSGLPKYIQDSLQSMGATGKTRALLMPGRGSDPGDVYLIANRLHDVPMAQFALFHEVLGHYGIRKVLGSDATYSAEMYKLRQANPALASEAEAWFQAHGRGAIAARVSRGMSMESAMKTVRALSTEEALADRAGRGEPIRNLQSLMAKIQQWLRSVGLHSVADRLESMTQAETASLLARARSTVEATEPSTYHGDELAPALSEDDTPALSQRADEPVDLPDAIVAHSLSDLNKHPDYAAAKAGDVAAAHQVAEDVVTPKMVDAVRAAAGTHDLIVQPVNSVEASGRNKIPLAAAEVLADRLGAEAAHDIVQSSSPKRSAMDGMDRLLHSPEFDGPVRTDKPYVLLDDALTQGGTVAALASHIRQAGGKVAGVVALAGKQYSRVLKPSPELLGHVRDRFASVEPDFRAATGHGFDALTESEARYLAKHDSPESVRDRIAAAGEQARRGAGQGDDRGTQTPLLSQHTDDGSEVPAAAGHAAAALAKVREAASKFGEAARAVRDDALLKTVPMALGTTETRTIAKDFANADRLARWQWGKFDDVLKKNYDEAQRKEMWEAADQENVLRQQDKTPGPNEGLNRLTPDQRATMDTLHTYGEQLLQRAKDVGMFEGEGLPYWTPRMAVMIDGNGEYTRPKGAGAETGAAQGRNIVTSASSLKGRKHLTSEETEAAMKGKLGDGAQLVRDIRTMPLAMARLERAIAGRELVNNIKAMGQRAGLETVSTKEQPGFFTVDHPAFKTWQATTSDDGTKSWEAKPLYVNKAFQGPLKAVMSETPGPIYSALMALKAKSMGLIMYSPLIHNAVEWGRALPAMPGKVATFQIYFEGNRIKNDPAQMRQAIKDGLVPIGRRGGIQDITGIMEDPTLKPGRSWTAKLIGGALGLANEKAGTAAKKGIDAAGDFWHNTLLWDRVGDLQAGLYGALREKEIEKGTDPAAAGKLAAHFANRFAGALPNEAMSAGARKVANILLFSRTFTLGNLGLMKDMVTGLPRDIQSQIRTASGDLAAAAATSRARRIAIASFIVDIGLMYVGNSLMQNVFQKMKGDKTLGEIGQGYVDRLHKLMQRTGDHPLDTLSNPFDAANSLSATSENEPGKEDRVRVGTQSDGTAIYMRLPTGKVGEDFKNWITKPLITAKAKESQLVRPLQAVWTNDNGIGQRIYDPDAKGLGGVLTNAGRIAKLFATQAIPTDAIQGALDWKNGKASDVDKLKVAGPLAGLTFSKGAPGGPEVGAMYDADRKFEGAKMDVMPAVKQAIKDGDDEKAIALLEGIKMTNAEINSTLRRLKVPESRMSAGAFRRFSQHASDDDMARMQQLLQGEQPAQAPSPAPAQ